MFPLKLLIDAGVIAADYIHRQSKYIGCNDTELAKDAAVIAAHVYGNRPNIKLRNSWKICRKNFGVVLEDRDGTGLVSKVYQRTWNGQKQSIYATAGTDPDNINDWIANFSQLAGFSEQYQHAVENARIISSMVGSAPLYFVGHSLGGGEAALNAMATGRSAITFNAAGVSNYSRTANSISLTKRDFMIDAYIVATDWLNMIQTVGNVAVPILGGGVTRLAIQKLVGISSMLTTADGKIHYLTPKSDDSMLNGHSMETVLASLGL